MNSRVEAFWRSRVYNLVARLPKDIQDEVLLIIQSYGLIHFSRALQEDLEEILSESPLEILTKGV